MSGGLWALVALALLLALSGGCLIGASALAPVLCGAALFVGAALCVVLVVVEVDR